MDSFSSIQNSLGQTTTMTSVIKDIIDNLINNKYIYTNYQTSQFYGLNLLIKLLFDKILTINPKVFNVSM